MSLDEIRAFLKASEGVHFEGEKKEEVYAWVSGCLGEQKWDELGRTARGLVRRYVEKMTGLSRAQITRLITRYGEDGEVRLKRSRRRSMLRHQNTKPSYEKENQTHPQIEALCSLPLVGPETVAHESTFKERRPAYPIPIPQAHSWMRKCFLPAAGSQPALASQTN